MISRLWPPAAATSSARRRPGWPRRSARSGSGRRRWRRAAGRPAAAPARRRCRASRSCSSRSSGTTRPAATSAASAPQRGGDGDRPQPGPPRAPRPSPASPGPAGSSRRAPARRRARRRRAPPAGSWPEAASSAAAIARSKPGPALRRSAGARLAVIRCCGKLEAGVDERRAHPLARLAHRRVGQADERERRQAAADVDLDVDLARLDAEQREGAGDRRASPTKLGSGAARGWRADRRRIRHARGAIARAGRRLRVGGDDRRPPELGRGAEALVAATLERDGWRIVARNARTAEVRGEIDLIALDGARAGLRRGQGAASRLGARPGAPAMAVGPRKRAKLRAPGRRLAARPRLRRPPPSRPALRRGRPAARRRRPGHRVRAPARRVLEPSPTEFRPTAGHRIETINPMRRFHG